MYVEQHRPHSGKCKYIHVSMVYGGVRPRSEHVVRGCTLSMEYIVKSVRLDMHIHRCKSGFPAK